MLIRKMTLEDVSAAVEIENQCFSLPWSEKSFEESIHREDTIFLVCEDNAADNGQVEVPVIVGYMGLYVSFDEASVTNVAVSPNCRKKGYGEGLVVAAKEAVKAAGADKIFLEVRISNHPAISLYKKQGFKELGIRKKFYEHPVEDAYIMMCNLNE